MIDPVPPLSLLAAQLAAQRTAERRNSSFVHIAYQQCYNPNWKVLNPGQKRIVNYHRKASPFPPSANRVGLWNLAQAILTPNR